MSIAAGTRFGPYQIVALIGAGGMGEVYRARDTRLGREVAVKTLPSAYASEPERLRRFEVEAKAASLLSHPNILTVHDIGTREGHYHVENTRLLKAGLIKNGWIEGDDLHYEEVQGGTHSEGAWAERFGRMLVFNYADLGGSR